MSDNFADRMRLLDEEIKALNDLYAAKGTLTGTAVVDDDFPRVRHNYDRSVLSFLDACKANGRRMP